jgi:hypothetical protein
MFVRMAAMLNRLVRRSPGSRRIGRNSRWSGATLLARNRSHNRTRPRILFRVLVLSIALFPDDKQLLVRHAKRDYKFACRNIKGEDLG